MSNTRSHKVKLIGTQRWHHEVVDLGGQNDRDNSPAVNSSLVMLIMFSLSEEQIRLRGYSCRTQTGSLLVHQLYPKVNAFVSFLTFPGFGLRDKSD